MTVRAAADPAVDSSGVSARLGRRPGERWSRFAGRVANAFGLVLLLVIASYALGSLIPTKGWSAVVIATAVSAAAVAALASSAVGPNVLRYGLLGSFAAVILAVIAALANESAPLAASALIEMMLLATAMLAILRAVVSQREVGFRTILGAVSVYVMLGLLFTFLFLAIDRLQTGPFFTSENGPHTGDFLFFSITTLTTTGYGNLVPAAQPGKLFAGLEMLTGQIFVVTFVAGLVSLWRPRGAR
jgi:Ion channel